MSAVLNGLLEWSVDRDDEGHRTYTATHQVGCNPGDGPSAILSCPGLPSPGSSWNIAGDFDVWATCRLGAKVKMLDVKKGEKAKIWGVEQTWSTKPFKRCNEAQVEDPLLEPQKVSGTFKLDKEEATYDRFGKRILNSAHEMVRGPQNEWDYMKSQVQISQNVPLLQLELCAAFANCVNSSTLWGNPRRCIKLSEFSWEKKYFGLCNSYYTRNFGFEVYVRKSENQQGAQTATIAAGGFGYTQDSYVVLDGGAHSTPAMLVVTSVSTAGAILAVSVAAPGRYTSVPSNPVSSSMSTSSGSGAQFNVTWGDSIQSGFDRDILDEGTKVLNGHWDAATGGWVLDNINGVAPDPENPAHFVRFQDRNGNTARVILNGAGLPAEVSIGTGSATPTTIGSIYVEKYDEANFLLLGIPTVL